ncbi:MAG: phosphoenolpyruvate-utilizing N-terminal domain-containing protein, partial [Acidobacteriota bacterium]|nr:phosphoenolpyruvate-utilizing N-terminal domain-containing protein [Acidobacteriota bacterium]
MSTSHRAMVTLAGTGVSGGIAIGRAVCIADAGDDVLRFQLADEEIETEMERFAQAQVFAVAELRNAQAEMGRVVGTDLAGILEAQAMLLEDRSFGGRITARIRGRQVNAEWAVLKECE